MKGNAYNGFEDVQQRLQQIEMELPSDYKERYRPTDFFFNMGENYAAADLVIAEAVQDLYMKYVQMVLLR